MCVRVWGGRPRSAAQTGETGQTLSVNPRGRGKRPRSAAPKGPRCIHNHIHLTTPPICCLQAPPLLASPRRPSPSPYPSLLSAGSSSPLLSLPLTPLSPRLLLCQLLLTPQPLLGLPGCQGATGRPQGTRPHLVKRCHQVSQHLLPNQIGPMLLERPYRSLHFQCPSASPSPPFPSQPS